MSEEKKCSVCKRYGQHSENCPKRERPKWAKPEPKVKTLRDLIAYHHWGVIPEHEVTEDEKREWNLRFDAANLMGMTDEAIEQEARKQFAKNVRSQRGAGCLGDETWELDCHPSRRYHYINHILPQLSRGEVTTYPKSSFLLISFSKNEL